MDKSIVGSAIEKIKRQEQNQEAKLKAKREIEATVASRERSIAEVNSQIFKYRQERLELTKKTEELRVQLTIQKIRRDALDAQLIASNKELKELKDKVEHGISEIWDLRSSYCQTVQDISDECDVWALLMKPVTSEPLPRTKKFESADHTLVNEVKLKNAIEKHEKAVIERERLLAEPDTGEEFVRIKNALRYSMEMTANLRN